MKAFKKFSVLLVLTLQVIFAACSTLRGNGNITSQERTVGEFNGVILRGTAKINICFAENRRVVVTTDSNIQELVTTATRNNVLNVDLKRDVKDVDITVDVYLPKIDG
jgi:hypothetical protein